MSLSGTYPNYGITYLILLLVPTCLPFGSTEIPPLTCVAFSLVPTPFLRYLLFGMFLFCSVPSPLMAFLRDSVTLSLDTALCLPFSLALKVTASGINDRALNYTTVSGNYFVKHAWASRTSSVTCTRGLSTKLGCRRCNCGLYGTVLSTFSL